MEDGLRVDSRRKVQKIRRNESEDHCGNVGTEENLRGHTLITPKPLPNPVTESKERKELHRELMWNQRIGHQVLNTKTELQRALEERRLQQSRKTKVGEETLPEFMQVHKRITSGNQSS